MKKKAYYIGLKPWEFGKFTFGEFIEYYNQQLERMKDDYKANERLMARFMCLFANAHRDSKTKPLPFKEDDFIAREKKKQTVEQMETVLKVIALSFGGGENG